MNEQIKEYFSPGKQNIVLIYILYLAGLISPIFSFIGVTLAYINRDNTHNNSHYIFLFRTFGIYFLAKIILKILFVGLLAQFIAGIISIVLISSLISILLKVWYVVRMIIGINLIIHNKPHPHPETLFFLS